jgi:diaminohydroxyphosphoribosylaminopyrimidine deaminase / 5-amino-6-(5-phosphoribosylamino)uracil reductase
LNNSDKKLYLITSKVNIGKQKVNTLSKRGVNLIYIKEDSDGRLNLKSILRELAKLNVASVLVEGGGEIFSSFIKNNLFDDILLFISPKILGDGISFTGDLGIRNVKKALKLKIRETERIGDDMLIELIR